MAATPKGPKKMKIDYNIDREIYNDYVRACSNIGYTPNVVIERLMKKFVETGQM
jgi:hypothetical protein